ncbi:hypothetical protein BLNAU_20307 [Blattamonas nauphoetae]|uniref:Uncharacterized protein n=1 Tax=Blattamonas nauphoetae TaxID=2049346 RepID=A0ABQ9WZ45_9EUKA|nr:hypothetical protein BLNAU_20307 [Blattamonas nauphoetae]
MITTKLLETCKGTNRLRARPSFSRHPDTADGTPPFTRDIEFVVPHTAAGVERNEFEIDGSQFRYGTEYTITFFKTKSDQTDILSQPLFFTIPPARPTPIDESSIVDLSGFEDLRCGYGTDQPCLNLIQAIHNQLTIPEMLISYSLLTVKVRTGGIAKAYLDIPVISDEMTIWGEVDSGVVPTIKIQSNQWISVERGSKESASLSLIDLVFDFASEWNVLAFIVITNGDFSMLRRVITETTSAHGTFFSILQGVASFVDCELKDIKSIDTILRFPHLSSSLFLDAMKVTNCGQHDSASLCQFGSGMTSIEKLDMTGCEAEDAQISLFSQTIFAVISECSWTACKGSNFAGALSFSPSSPSTIIFHHCRWIDCSVNSASQPTCLFLYFRDSAYFNIVMTNLTFVNSDESHTKPHLLIYDANLRSVDLDKFLFDYWTEPNMFLVQSDYIDPQPISSLTTHSYFTAVVAPTRNDELLFGIDSPICGTDDRPCATVGRALSHTASGIGEQPIVSICDGGKAELGTRIQNETICGEVRTARLVLLRHELSLDGTPFFTTSQATIHSVVIDHSASTADVLIKHEQWHLEMSHVRFSTTASTAPTLLFASAGTVALRFVSFDSVVFVSSAISIATVTELSIVSLSSFNTSFHSPLLTIRSLDPNISQASLSGMNVTNFSFGGSNELLIDARQATVLISECHFAGRTFVPSRCNSDHPQIDLNLSLSASPLVGHFDSENQSRHPSHMIASDSQQRFSNSVCLWTEDGTTLRCSFDDTRMALSSLEWRVSVSCDGLETWNMPVVRRAIRGDAKAESRETVLVSVSSVVFGVLGVIGVSLIVSIVILSQKLRKG